MGIYRPGLRSCNTDTLPAKEKKIKTKIAPRIISTEGEVRIKSQREGNVYDCVECPLGAERRGGCRDG